MNIPTEHSQKQGKDDVTEAAKELLHLHSCEQEGLQSGKPTPKMWFDAVNKLSDAIEKYSTPPKPLDDGQEGKGLDEGKQGEQSGSCTHEFVSYKQCCYCGAFENYSGEIIEKRTQSNVENLRTMFGDWYFSIKNQHGYPPLAMQIFYWFDKNLGIFNALTNTTALPVADGEGEVDWIKNANERQPLTSVVKEIDKAMIIGLCNGVIKSWEHFGTDINIEGAVDILIEIRGIIEGQPE